MKHHPQGCGQGAEVHTLQGRGCASSPSVGPLRTTQGPPAWQGWPCSLPGFPLMPSPFRVTAPTAPRVKLLGSAGSGRWPRPGRCFTDSSRRYSSPPPRLQAHLRSCSALPPDPGVTAWGALGICVGRARWRAAVRRVRADVPSPTPPGLGARVPPPRPLPSQVERESASSRSLGKGFKYSQCSARLSTEVPRLRATLARGSQPAAPAGPRPGVRATPMPVSLLRARPEQGRLLGSNC